jgi:hypothetical protein
MPEIRELLNLFGAQFAFGEQVLIAVSGNMRGNKMSKEIY